MKLKIAFYYLFTICILAQIVADPITIKSSSIIKKEEQINYTSLCISKDDTLIAYGCENGQINILELATHKSILKIESKSEISHLIFNNSVSKLFSAEKNGNIISWDLKTANKEIIGKDLVTFMTISPNDKNIVTAKRNYVKIWSIEEKKVIQEFTEPKSEVRSVCYSPNGELLCFPNEKEIIIKNISSGATEKINAHRNFIEKLAFSPDGKYIMSCGWDKRLYLWNISTKEKIFSLPIASSHSYFSLCPNKTILIANGDKIGSINLETGENKTLLAYIGCRLFAFSNNYELLIGAHHEGLKLWSIELDKKERAIKKTVEAPVKIQLKKSKVDSLKVISTFRENYKKVKPNKLSNSIFSVDETYAQIIKFSPDEKTMATSHFEGHISFWSLDQNKYITKIKAHDGIIHDIVFSPDGDYLVSTGVDNAVKIWNTKTFELSGTMDLDHEVFSLDINSHGDLALGGYSLEIYNLNKGEVSQTFPRNSSSIDNIQFHPNKRTLFTFCEEVITIYDLENNTVTTPFAKDEYIDFCFSMDGTKLVLATETKISIFSVDGWKQIHTIDFPQKIKATFISPDNSIIGARDSVGKYHFWIVESGKKLIIENDAFFAYTTNISPSFNCIVSIAHNKIAVQKFTNSYSQKILSLKTKDIIKSKQLDKFMGEKKAQPKSSIVILPFTVNNKHRYLGTYMALVSLFQATYVPEQVLGASLLYMEALFANKQILFSEKIANNKLIQKDLQSYFNTQNILHGNILYKNKTYNVQLKFYGEHGKFETQKKFAENELNAIPSWVASIVHQYLKIPLTAKQKEYCQKIYYKNSHVLKKAASLYVLHYLNYRGFEEEWEQLVNENPQSIFFLGAYNYNRTPEEIEAKALEYNKKYPNHPYLTDILISSRISQKYYYQAEEMIFPLFKERFGDVFLYWKAYRALKGQEKWEEIQELLQYLKTKGKNAYWFHCIMGTFYIDYAWNARGSGWAYTVSDEQFALFEQRLEQAEKHFVAAYKINPNNIEAPSQMITVCMGRGHSKKTMELWFQRATQKKPYDTDPYMNKWEYLKPKWHGSNEELLQFAQEISETVPPHSRCRLIATNIYKDMYHYDVDQKTWYAIKRTMEPYLKTYPSEFYYRSDYQAHATTMKDYSVATQQYMELERLNRIPFLKNNVHYSGIFKFDLYIALSNAYKQKKDTIKTKEYLQKALHLNSQNWQYQNEYADLLLEQKQHNAAKEHYTAVLMGDSNDTQKSHAKQIIEQMEPFLLKNKTLDVSKLRHKKIYIVAYNIAFQESILQNQVKDMEKTFGIQIEFLPEIFTPQRASYVFEHSNEISSLYERFKMGLGEVEIEKVAARLGIKNDRTIGSDNAIVKFLLEQTTEGQLLWKEIEENYTNYYHAKKLAYNLKKIYEHRLNQESTLGILCILKSTNLGLDYNKKLFAYGEKNIGIVSYNNIMEPKDKQLERIEKQLLYTIAKIINLPEGTLPHCPLTTPTSLEHLDNQNQVPCHECTENIHRFQQANQKK